MSLFSTSLYLFLFYIDPKGVCIYMQDFFFFLSSYTCSPYCHFVFLPLLTASSEEYWNWQNFLAEILAKIRKEDAEMFLLRY